jgi:hypothetical protein
LFLLPALSAGCTTRLQRAYHAARRPSDLQIQQVAACLGTLQAVADGFCKGNRQDAIRRAHPRICVKYPEYRPSAGCSAHEYVIVRQSPDIFTRGAS